MNTEAIKNVLAKHGRLSVDVSTLDTKADLYESGLSSLTTVNLMLALEDQFEIEFPEKLLSRKTFQSIESLDQAISEIKGLIQ